MNRITTYRNVNTCEAFENLTFFRKLYLLAMHFSTNYIIACRSTSPSNMYRLFIIGTLPLSTIRSARLPSAHGETLARPASFSKVYPQFVGLPADSEFMTTLLRSGEHGVFLTSEIQPSPNSMAPSKI